MQINIIHDKFVFLFVTETENQDDGNILGNRIYRYDFVNGILINPVLLLDLPYLPGPSHNGGVMRIGPDNNLYVVIGDLNRLKDPSGDTITQNLEGTYLLMVEEEFYVLHLMEKPLMMNLH